ncbi:hypothetical protein L3Q72_09740 [Vibrio sp. JC009]|uniref:VC2046/SO_2500 family protein n=1 Tax=Vibrio sp. JC009 TaxID=2912314 RepID=UPI0023B1ABD6|nr:VC2046/SO_2500 family protein [Vibrio sp. JC009]WED20922.1 hypothetical protein L3Q72_09740 [Vibrio sp. JC009]
MQVQETVTNNLITEFGLGSNISQAVSSGNRADFALMLAMLTTDAREIEPVEPFDTTSTSEEQIRVQLGVSDSQPLKSSESTYDRGAEIARQFHGGGMQSARLQNGLLPDAMAYMALNTHDLDEDVYRNLSSHEQRLLEKGAPATLSTNDLYQKLLVAGRTSQIQAQA